MGQRNRSLFIQQLLENNYFEDEEEEEDDGIDNWESRTTAPLLRNEVPVVERSSPEQDDRLEWTAGQSRDHGEDKSTSGDNEQLGGGVKSDREDSSEASSQHAIPQNSFLKIRGGESGQLSVAASMMNTSTSTSKPCKTIIMLELSEDLDSTSGSPVGGRKDEVDSKPSDVMAEDTDPSEDMGQNQVGYQTERRKLERGKAFQKLELERGKGCQNLECLTSDSSASSSECSLTRRLSFTTDWVENSTFPVALPAEVFSSREAISTSFAQSSAQEASITQCVKLLMIAREGVEDCMTGLSKVGEPAIAVSVEDKTIFTDNSKQNFFFKPLKAVEQSQFEVVSTEGTRNGLGTETPKSQEWKEEEPSLAEDSQIQHSADNKVAENDEPEVAEAAPARFEDNKVMEPDLNVWTGQGVTQAQAVCLELEVEKAVTIEELTDGAGVVVPENNTESTSDVETAVKLDGQSKALELEASFTRLEPQQEFPRKESEEIVQAMRANGTVVSTDSNSLEETRAGGCGGGYFDNIHAATMGRCGLAARDEEHGMMGHDTDIQAPFSPPWVAIYPNNRKHTSAPSLSNVSPMTIDNQAFAAGIGSDLEAPPQLPFGVPLGDSQQDPFHSQILVFGAKLKRKIPADALTRTRVGTLRGKVSQESTDIPRSSPSTVWLTHESYASTSSTPSFKVDQAGITGISATHGDWNNKKSLIPVEASTIEVHDRDLNPDPASIETTTIQRPPLQAALLEGLETVSSQLVKDDGKSEKQLGWGGLSNSELERETPV